MLRQSSIVFNGVDSPTPLNEPLSGKYLKSFAYTTIKDRLPVILTTVVDLLSRHKDELTKCQDLAESDLKSCMAKVVKLKNEVQTNKSFIEMTSKEEDIKIWNDYLEEQNRERSLACWFESPWLYSECYMYRRLQDIFHDSTTLGDYDCFTYQKRDALEKSLGDVKTVALYIQEALVTHTGSEKENIINFIKIALFGNRSDLSISAVMSLPNYQFDRETFKSLDRFLLHDDTLPVYYFLKNSQPSGLLIDYVLDNSGYELFCDLCLCDLLCTCSLVKNIRFHVKKFPWYVSDVTRKDIKVLLSKMSEIGLEDLSKRWEGYFLGGTWSVHDENFWTLPFSYNQMWEKDRELYDKLCEADLVVFKGDLNYRKLARDINWSHTEKYDVVLGKFRPARVLALRTVKSDLLFGLHPEKCKEEPSDPNWMTTGEYGVIQFWSNE